MPRKQILLDQNYLRSDELRDAIARDSSVRFIFPDEALLEMCKSEHWELILTRSLTILSAAPSRVRMTTSMGVGLAWESQNKKSIAGRLVDVEATEFLREILMGVSRGEVSNGVTVMRERMSLAQTEVREEEFNHVENKKRLLTLVESSREFLRPDFQKRLRAGAATRDEVREAVRSIAPEVLGSYCASAGFSREKAKVFLASKPLTLRFAYAGLLNTFSWLARGGVMSYAGERATNDAVDRNYAVLASFFDGFWSKDVKAAALYEDIARIIAH